MKLAIAAASVLALPSAWGQCPPDVLIGSDTLPGDRFGAAVSIFDDVLIVGASKANVRGKAYIFERSFGAWVETAKLEPTQASFSPQDQFGNAVDVEGELAVVGAPGRDSSTGIVYVYERTDNGWEETSVIPNPTGLANQRFGIAVAIEDEQIFASRNHGPSASPHAVHVYARNGAVWLEVDTLVPTEDTHQFGVSLAVQGNRAIVGANEPPLDPGSAFVFERIGGQWVQQQRLIASDGVAYDIFGSAVALDGDTAIVGAHFENNSRGSAYAFQRDPQSNTWSEQAKLKPTDDEVDPIAFGIAVALNGDTAFVGAPSDIEAGSSAGAVYVFERQGTTWTETRKILPPSPGSIQAFGISVSEYNGDPLLVGASFADVAAVDSNLLGSTYCSANANSTGSVATIHAVGDCEAANNDVLLVATQLPPDKFGYFLLSETQGFFVSPGGSQGNLCVGGTIGRFQSLVQHSGPAGEFEITVDLTNVPLFGAILAGETWNFQCWYRDVGGNSNFTGGIEIPFQ